MGMSFPAPKSKEETVTKTGDSDALLTDGEKTVEFDNGANPYAYTVQPDATINHEIGTRIEVLRLGAGEITITKGAGVTFHTVLGDVNFKIDLIEFYSIYLLKIAANTWRATGAVKAV